MSRGRRQYSHTTGPRHTSQATSHVTPITPITHITKSPTLTGVQLALVLHADQGARHAQGDQFQGEGQVGQGGVQLGVYRLTGHTSHTGHQGQGHGTCAVVMMVSGVC